MRFSEFFVPQMIDRGVVSQIGVKNKKGRFLQTFPLI
jgi:hypothetical protein